MADLKCALFDASATVTRVIVCCNGDPATCSLNPIRCPEGTAVAPGWNYANKTFTPPASTPATQPLVVTQVTTRQFVLQAQATTLPGKTQTLWQTIKAMFVLQPDLGDVFNHSSVIARQDPMFLAAAATLGIDSPTQDAFFLAASLL